MENSIKKEKKRNRWFIWYKFWYKPKVTHVNNIEWEMPKNKNETQRNRIKERKKEKEKPKNHLKIHFHPLNHSGNRKCNFEAIFFLVLLKQKNRMQTEFDKCSQLNVLFTSDIDFIEEFQSFYFFWILFCFMFIFFSSFDWFGFVHFESTNRWLFGKLLINFHGHLVYVCVCHMSIKMLLPIVFLSILT